LSTDTEIKEEEKEATSSEEITNQLPLTETPIVLQNDDLYFTPPERVSQIPRIRPKSAELIGKTLNYD